MKLRTLFLLGVTAALALQTSPQTKEPWDAAFSGNPKAVLEAAKRIDVPDAQGVVLLLEEHQYTIDEKRRTTARIRKVYRIVKQDSVEYWSSVEQEYEPWHESRPELRARVISADGKEHWLDPKTIADAPAQEYDDSIYSDRRVLRAPLPAVAAGAVVEYEIVSRETAPLLDAGEARRIYVPSHAPMQRFRVAIEASKSVPLHAVARGFPESALRRQESGNTTRVECELGPRAVKTDYEAGVPSEAAESAYIAFSTGRSWQEIAGRYEAIVDEQIRAAELKPFLEGMELKGNALVVAARLVAKLHREIRYTGVEFGEAAIVPRTPAETLKRKYGDCKDKAALLVALLRAAGLNANVALLSAGSGIDVDAEAPGLGMFNHAIVYVSGENPMWIDATADTTRVGELPLSDQGRLALIASGKTPGLVKTAESRAEDNWRRHNFEIRMSEFGPSEIHETVETHGSMETQMRQLYADSGKKTQEMLENYVKRDLLAKTLGPFQVTQKDDFSERFRLSLQAQSAKRAFTSADDAVAVVFPFLVFSELPYPLSGGFENEAGEEKAKPRRLDFEFYEPHRLEYRYRIYPPALFKAKSLPSPEEKKLGAATYSREFKQNADGTIDAVFRFDSGKRRISAAEYEAMREGLRQYNRSAPEVLTFISEASEYAAAGEAGKALKLVREHAAKHAEQSASQLRMSRMLVMAGAVESAIPVAQKVLEREPTSSQAWQGLGWAYQHDSFGRRFRGNWNAAEAEKCYREAIRLDTEDIIPRVDLAILLEHNQQGQRYGKGSRMEEAITLYREVLKGSPNPTLQQNLVVALLYAGRYAEAKEEGKKLPGETAAVLPVVITALSEGAARAIVDVQTSYLDARSRGAILLNAAQTLLQARQYDRANELLKAASRTFNFGDLNNRTEMLSKLKRYEDALFPREDPRYPVQQLFVALFSAEADMSRLKLFFTKREDMSAAENEPAKMKRALAATKGQLESLGLTQENVLDLLLSLVKMEKDGEEDKGYRISAEKTRDVPFPAMYVIREDGEYRILGSTNSAEHAGELVLELLERGDVKSAQWWLDKIVPELTPTTPEGTGGSAARYLWSGVTEQARGPEAIRVAAAALTGTFAGSEPGIQILKEARAKSTVQIEKGQLDVALCQSYEKAKKWAELLAVARRLGTMQTFANDGFQFVANALTGLQQWKELQGEAERKSKATPENMPALRAMATALVHSGNREGASEYFRKAAESILARPEDRMLEAWNAMVVGKVEPNLLTRLSEKKFLGEDRADYWYTLGMLQAYAHQPEEAQRSLLAGLEHDDFSALDAKPWVLQGKIFELYGEMEAAAAAYEKAKSSPRTNEMAEWAVLLAVPGKIARPEEKMKQ